MNKLKVLNILIMLVIIFLGFSFCQNIKSKLQISLQDEISKFIDTVKKERLGKLEEDPTTNIVIVTFCKKDKKSFVVMRDAVAFFTKKVKHGFVKDEYLVVFYIKNQECFDLFSIELKLNKEILSKYSNERSENALETVYENSKRVFDVKNNTLQLTDHGYDFDCD